MPWQFVEMYGQSNVVDYLIERALTAHSELLLACSATTFPASRRPSGAVGSWTGDVLADESLAPAAIESAVLGQLTTTRRVVAACWWTLEEGVEPEMARAALVRDSQLANVLSDLSAPLACADLLEDLCDSSAKAKTKAALSRVTASYRLELAGAPGSISGDEARRSDEDLAELAIGWVETDAAAWREVEGVGGVVTEGGVFASDSIVDAFDRGASRAQRWLAKPKAKHARKLANHARRLSWQLALLRGSLGEENRALAWYADKLLDELTSLDLLERLLRSDAVAREEGKDALRVRGALDARSEQSRSRVEKLISRVYGQSRGELAARLEEEIAALDVDRQIVLVAPTIS